MLFNKMNLVNTAKVNALATASNILKALAEEPMELMSTIGAFGDIGMLGCWLLEEQTGHCPLLEFIELENFDYLVSACMNTSVKIIKAIDLPKLAAEGIAVDDYFAGRWTNEIVSWRIDQYGYPEYAVEPIMQVPEE